MNPKPVLIAHLIHRVRTVVRVAWLRLVHFVVATAAAAEVIIAACKGVKLYPS